VFIKKNKVNSLEGFKIFIYFLKINYILTLFVLLVNTPENY